MTPTPKIIAQLKAWAELRNAVASLWLVKIDQQSDACELAVELRPTRGRHDWALAEYIAYADDWRADLSRLTQAKVRLVAFRNESDRPFDSKDATALLIWERTSAIAAVK